MFKELQLIDETVTDSVQLKFWSMLKLFRKPPWHAWLYVLFYTKEEIDQWQREKSVTEILMWLSEQSLELDNVSKEASRNFNC